MKKIECYQCSDGQIFASERDAKAHENNIHRYDKVLSLVSEKFNGYYDDDHKLAKDICIHAEELLAVLSEFANKDR